MKTVVPKHVEAWLFDMWIELWPFKLKMWQLFLIAIWVAITFSIMNWLMKSGLWKVPSFIIASPWLIIMLFIAFFRKSELHIIPFTLKLLRTYVITTPKTFQKNIIKPASWEVKLAYAKLNKWEEKDIKQKELNKNKLWEDLDILKKW